MSTNKSEHLQLHLWEPGDSVLRTEFNENWEKLDGETAQIRADSIMTRLGQYKNISAAVNAVFDLSGVDMSKFYKLELLITGVTAGDASLWLRVNKDTGSGRYVDSGGNASDRCYLAYLDASIPVADITVTLSNGPGRVYLAANYSTYHTASSRPSGSGSLAAYSGCALSGLTSITVQATKNLNKGIEMILYGYRK